MKTIFERKVASEAMTKNVAQKIFTDFLNPSAPCTVFIEGGLGAGKTFFVREILRLFGVEEDISSPTYTYVQEYEVRGKHFAHFDLYRIKNSADFFSKGFQDIADDAAVTKFVEWPQKLEKETLNGFSGKLFTIVIDHGLGASMRTIKVLEK